MSICLYKIFLFVLNRVWWMLWYYKIVVLKIVMLGFIFPALTFLHSLEIYPKSWLLLKNFDKNINCRKGFGFFIESSFFINHRKLAVFASEWKKIKNFINLESIKYYRPEVICIYPIDIQDFSLYLSCSL